MAFQSWVEYGGGADDVARFSITHHITGDQAWVAAFVLMALTEVVTRLAAIFIRSRSRSRSHVRVRTESAPAAAFERTA